VNKTASGGKKMNNVFRDKFGRLLFGFCSIAVALLIFESICVGQGGSTGSISGTVVDPNKAFVAGATVVITNDATKQEITVVTNEEGYFRVPSLGAGTYSAIVTGQGFKKTNVTQIKVDVGSPSTITVQMALGAPSEEVTVTGGGELLRTETATVGTTLTGRQITDIPTASRDALDLVLTMPGTSTPGRPRSSTVNGLPKGALNITIDGINVQDNLLRSSDGFFTYVRPKTDAVGEVTVSTSNPGAESSGEGAVQIKFVTQGGSSDFRGGLYWYHRQPIFNTNYWFNNRDLPADPVTHSAPQQRILLNQYGGKLGGPIWIPKLFGRDKAFFFVNYEEYRLPEKSPLRTRTILTPQAQSGLFRFTNNTNIIGVPNLSCATNPANAANFLCSFDLVARANSLASSTIPGSFDPTISKLLGQIRSSVSGYTIVDTGNPNLQQVSFFNSGGQTRKFPTVRFDFNPWKDHHFENIWNYQVFRSSVDFLNSADPIFPDFPNFGSQDSNRFSNATAWVWNINKSIVNEARLGIVGGTSLFSANVNPGQFENNGGYALNINAAGINNGYIRTAFERRNSPVQQFTDTLTWNTGSHSFSFGTSYTQINLWRIAGNAVPAVNFGVNSTLDNTAFTGITNGLPTGQQAGAAALYATLTGRITSVAANANASADGTLTYNGPLYQAAQQKEYGFFGQDTWKIRPNLTLTAGLRWEVQGPFIPKNDTFSIASIEALYGESGVGNIFKPGTLTGSPSVFTRLSNGGKIWDTDMNNIAPSLGIAWQPNWGKGFLHPIFGDAGQTVIRGGYSRAFVREGTNTFLSIVGSNPGPSITATQNITGSPFSLPVGSLLRNGVPAPPSVPSSLTFPYAGTFNDSVNVFDPNLETGYVDSYSVGIQRELTPDMAIEFRYVSNRGSKLWRQYDINEVNIVENGFLDEFKLAQQNFIANVQAGRGANFRYFGPNTGTSPLPIMLAWFTGLAPTAANASNTANYTTSTSCQRLVPTATPCWQSTTFTSLLNILSPSPLTFAATLNSTGNSALFDPARIAAGIPINTFYANPGHRGGGSFIVDNSSKTWYDAFQFEFRRRLTKGLLIQMNYTFSKAQANTYASSSSNFDQPGTLREGKDVRRGLSPFDVTHAVKTNFIWELPVGRGKWLAGDSSNWVNHLVGGWGINGNIRWQSGTPLNLGNVQLVGMTAKELQKEIGIYYGQADASGTLTNRDVYFLPLDIRQNTFKAFNLGLVSNVATFTQGAPTGRYLAPANFNGCIQAYSGQCGFQNLVLKGPDFFRADISVVKRIRFTERINGEIRAEFLNAFNNINFIAGSAANDVNTIGGMGATTFARFTAAYQDVSTTNDPGGRLTQLVFRLNF
jgi:hypothetical protein